MPNPFLLSRILLQFRPNCEALLGNLSALTVSPDGCLWLGSDELNLVDNQELNTVERLSLLESAGLNAGFGNHQPFVLHNFIEIDDRLGEIDIEGLDCDNSYLWLTGSHSSKRKKPKGNDIDRDLERLATVEADPNRYLIARIPLVNGQLHKACPDPQDTKQQLTAACLPFKKQENTLTKALKNDLHLGPYLTAMQPSKENGFDVEGIAARGSRVFLGLRGPVLRGWAMLLELEISETASILQLQPIASENKAEQLYRKHFLQLDGLGIRDLCFRGSDLLILAGPTMDLAGSLRVYCWRDAISAASPTVLSQVTGTLELLLDLPFSPTGDKAEGIALISWLGEEALMVVYDSPNPERIVGTNGVWADLFRLV